MSHIGNNISLVLYDITSQKLRRKIDKALKDFGQRLQYSVFLCKLDDSRLLQCRERIQNVIDAHAILRKESDSIVLFHHLGSASAHFILGNGETLMNTKFAIY